MATKTTNKTSNQHNPEYLEEQVTKLTQQLTRARAAADQARATVATARDNALLDYWQNRITEFYDQVRPHVAKAWENFAQTVTDSTETDTLTAWRAYAMARARAQGEHETLRKEAARQGLRGVRPMLALPKGGYAECVTRVLTEWEDTHRHTAGTHLLTTAEDIGAEADERARSQGTVPQAPRIVARFKLGPSATSRDSGTYAVALRNPGDGRTVYFRDGLYYARDEETAQLLREHARGKSIREINENGEEIDTFGDTFVPRP